MTVVLQASAGSKCVAGQMHISHKRLSRAPAKPAADASRPSAAPAANLQGIHGRWRFQADRELRR